MIGPKQLASVLLLCVSACVLARAGQPGAEWRFTFPHALPQWGDGLPVGNGRLGAQVWGTGPRLFLTVDQSEIWDLRYVHNTSANYSYARLRELVKKGDKGTIQKELAPDVGHMSPTNLTPTRVNIGNVRLDLPPDTTVDYAELDMQTAEVRWGLRVQGRAVRCRVVALLEPSVLLLTLDGVQGWKPEVTFEPLEQLNPKLVERLGYAKPVFGSEAGFSWAVQAIPDSGRAATVWTTRSNGDSWSLWLTIPPPESGVVLAAARAGRPVPIEPVPVSH
jgi:hypothetical protein